MRNRFVALALLALSTFNSQLSTAFAQGTAFTYQGQLLSGGVPVNGSYDIQFTLFATNVTGTAVAGPETNTAVSVSNGLFTTAVDFGPGIFTGGSNWLQIAVSTNRANNFSTLAPRQQLTPAPNAVYAEGAGGLPGLIVQPNAGMGTVNLIGGSPENVVESGFVGATIGGGGTTNYGGFSYLNSVTGNFGTVGGGFGNSAGSAWATVSGGSVNIAGGNYAAIGGGWINNASGGWSAVAGGYGNTASGLAAFVGGGGYDGSTQRGNAATGNASVVGGGVGNAAENSWCTVGGGVFNTNTGAWDTIAGGDSNLASNDHSAVGGGSYNTASGSHAMVGGGWRNDASGAGAFIGGGGYDGTSTSGNQAQGNASTIGGGLQNLITNGATYAFIGGGYNNTVSASEATVGGGYINTVSAVEATVGGGSQNIASNQWATVSGGNNNTAGAIQSTVGGGYDNLASGASATIGGGYESTASGASATVPGGYLNLASGPYSFAAGSYAQATNQGAFVWADNSAITTPFPSTNNNSFNVRAAGGYRLYTTSFGVLGGGVYLAPGGNSWTSISDRNAKKNFAPVDTAAVLEKLAAIPIQRWNYKWESDQAVPNIGPMAQDFKQAFYPGRDDTGISTLEFDGVEVAAIQGLNQKVEARSQTTDDRMRKLESENAELKAQNDLLANRLGQLESLVKQLAAQK